MMSLRFLIRQPLTICLIYGTITYQYGLNCIFCKYAIRHQNVKISGTVEIDVYLQDTSEIEAITETVKANVDGYFFSGKSETTILAKWNSTRYVDVADKKITVAAVLFTLLAFPNQQTCEPDPIKLVNKWTRKLLPDVSDRI